MSDPLSTVASCFAVISLTIQLIESTGKVQKVLRAINGASKEVRRLIADLALLQSILEDIKILAGEQQANPELPNPFDSSLNALRMCQSNLDTLRVFASKAKALHSEGRISRTMSIFSIMVERHQLKVLETLLHQSVTMLMVSHVANSTRISLALFQSFRTTQAKLSHPSNDVLVNTESSIGKSHLVRSDSNPVSSSVEENEIAKASSLYISTTSRQPNMGIVTYRLILAVLSFSTVSFQFCGPQLRAGNLQRFGNFGYKNTYTLTLSLISRQIDFQISKLYGQVERQLRISPVIHSKSKIYHVIWLGKTEDFLELICSGSFSPFTVDENGWNLLHYAAYYYSEDICRLLLQMNVDATAISHNDSRTPLEIAARPLGYRSSTGVARELIKTAGCDPMAAFTNGRSFLLIYQGCPKTFHWALNYCDISKIHPETLCFETENQNPPVRKTVLQNAVFNLVKSSSRDRQHWFVVVTDLVKKGVFSQCCFSSALDIIFATTFWQGDAEELATGYLNAIAVAGIDLAHFVREEERLRPNGVIRETIWDGRLRRIVFKSNAIKNRWTIQWYWMNECSEPLHLVFQEFMALCMSTFVSTYYPFEGYSIDIWCEEEFFCPWEMTWPFQFIPYERHKEQQYRFQQRLKSKKSFLADTYILRAAFRDLCKEDYFFKSFDLNGSFSWSSYWPYNTIIVDGAKEKSIYTEKSISLNGKQRDDINLK